jgi:hypothetical protein
MVFKKHMTVIISTTYLVQTQRAQLQLHTTHASSISCGMMELHLSFSRTSLAGHVSYVPAPGVTCHGALVAEGSGYSICVHSDLVLAEAH